MKFHINPSRKVHFAKWTEEVLESMFPGEKEIENDQYAWNAAENDSTSSTVTGWSAFAASKIMPSMTTSSTCPSLSQDLSKWRGHSTHVLSVKMSIRSLLWFKLRSWIEHWTFECHSSVTGNELQHLKRKTHPKTENETTVGRISEYSNRTKWRMCQHISNVQVHSWYS